MKLYKSLFVILLFLLTTLAFPWGSELCQGCRIDSSALAGPIYTFPDSQLFQQMISTNGTFLFQDAIDRLPAYSNGVKLEIRTQTKSPLRLAYDVNNYVDFSVSSSGSLTMNATGGVVISANGNVIVRNGNVGIGTTSPTNKLSVAGNADFSGNVGIGTTNPVFKLQVNGSAHFTEGISLGANYTTSYTTDSSWSSFQTVIPTGVLSANTVYLVSLSWTYSAGNSSPYYAFATTIFTVCTGTNGGGIGPEIILLTSTHQDSGAYLSVASFAGATPNTNGLKVKLNSFSTLGGTLAVKATKLSSI